jgi:FixJ family two-component response regulator
MEAGKIIAIVDDDDSVRESLTGLMQSVGLAVHSYASAEDYVHSGQVHETACAVLDIRLPGMSGLELQRALGRSGSVPVIFISAHADEKTRAEALAGGAIDLLPKPFSEEKLLTALTLALEQSTGLTPRLF